MGRTSLLRGTTRALPTVLVFFSGLAGLVYQVLWMRQLGLLFGNTAHAAATVLAVFFGGLACGSWILGNRVSRAKHPLRFYAVLEFGIAVGALFFFAVIPLFRVIYPALYQAIGNQPVLSVVTFALALLLIFPASFCMGGTIPAMGQYLITERIHLGRKAAWLYGFNTVGAAIGTLSAAFFLVPTFGFSATCVGAIIVSCSVATLALLLSLANPVSSSEDKRAKKNSSSFVDAGPDRQEARGEVFPVGRIVPALVAFGSGFCVLALEVLWTRMFAQVHENSVYSFSIVLVIVLVCLAIGALLSSLLARTKIQPWLILGFLLTGSGVALLFSPYVFLQLTDGLTMLPTAKTFSEYFIHLFSMGFLAIGPVCLLAGMVFPLLMKTEEHRATSVGRSIGTLTASNTAGAIFGALGCGFLLLPMLGIWHSLHTFAVVYLIAGCLLPAGAGMMKLVPRILSGIFLIAAFTLFHPSEYPVLATNPNWYEQEVLEIWDTGDCSVAVVKSENDTIGIKINSNYILGTTGAAKEQIYQGRIPLYIAPETESIFFLGMGTGMTAGSTLDRELFPNVKRVVACELVEEVVHAAKKYLTGGMDGIDYTFGLFDDPRVEIVIDDGRHYLMATDEQFDMIQADLFLPYRSGAGSLYSLDHYETVYESLSPDGVFVQWLPMFQLTEYEFGVIAHTMSDVFDHITMWRHDFEPGREIVALVGSRQKYVLPANTNDISTLKQQVVYNVDWQSLPNLVMPLNQDVLPLHYCGNLSKVKKAFLSYPLNTDDLPVIEYSSPISIRQKSSDGGPPTLVGPRFAALLDSLFAKLPPDQDPILAQRTSSNRRLPYAGAALHRAWVGYVMRDRELCQRAWEQFLVAWLDL